MKNKIIAIIFICIIFGFCLISIFAKDKLNFENADVLFLYSMLIINSSDILKVNMK